MICVRCNSPVDDDALKCPSCGVPMTVERSDADLGRRLVAMIVDAIIVGAFAEALGAIFGPLPDSLLVPLRGFGHSPMWLVTAILYYGLMEGSSRQATLGKMICGMRVARPDGTPVTFGRGVGRALSRLLSIVTGIGFIVAVFTDRNRALHDFVADTVVVDAS